MRFDYTNGKDARYIVSVYNWRLEDHMYYHYYKDAKAKFDKLIEQGFEEGTTLSIYDLGKDIRKAYKQF